MTAIKYAMVPQRRVRVVVLYAIIGALAVGFSLRPSPLSSESLHGVPSPEKARTNSEHDAARARSGGALGTDPSEAGHAPDSAAKSLDWKLLAMLNYRTGVVPPAIQQLRGKRVRVPGFIVPLEDFQDKAKEFLLVPYFGACVHMPPPPPNQMVYVRMTSSTLMAPWTPVWVEGELEVEKVDSPYGAVSYQMRGLRLIPYRQ